jgi:hypothetical protein
MNLIGAMLMSLWTAGWMLAMVRAGWKARAIATADTTTSK